MRLVALASVGVPPFGELLAEVLPSLQVHKSSSPIVKFVTSRNKELDCSRARCFFIEIQINNDPLTTAGSVYIVDQRLPDCYDEIEIIVAMISNDCYDPTFPPLRIHPIGLETGWKLNQTSSSS